MSSSPVHTLVGLIIGYVGAGDLISYIFIRIQHRGQRQDKTCVSVSESSSDLRRDANEKRSEDARKIVGQQASDHMA